MGKTGVRDSIWPYEEKLRAVAGPLLLSASTEPFVLEDKLHGSPYSVDMPVSYRSLAH